MQEPKDNQKKSQSSFRAEGIVPVFVNSFETLDGDGSVRINFGVSEEVGEEDPYFLCTASIGMSVAVARKLHEVLGEMLGAGKKEMVN